MRRKQKRGVYSNQTIKFCPTCSNFCTSCKGICKVQYGIPFDDETVAENHPAKRDSGLPMHVREVHKRGVGSLKAGKKFICYSMREHKCSKKEPKRHNHILTESNRFFKFDLLEQIRIDEIGAFYLE